MKNWQWGQVVTDLYTQMSTRIPGWEPTCFCGIVQKRYRPCPACTFIENARIQKWLKTRHAEAMGEAIERMDWGES